MAENQIEWNEGAGPAQPNQSLLGGLELMMELSLRPEPLGTRELARRLGWNVMRVNRLLKTLALAGMARRTEGGKYTTGAGMAVLAAQALHGSRLVKAATAAISDLPPGYGVALGVLWRDQVCYLFHTRTDTVSPVLGAHEPFEAKLSSIGRLLLACRGHRVPQAAQIRKQGWAHVVQNPAERQASLAVTVGSPPVAGLALTGVPDADAVARVLAPLQAVAARIAQEAGV